MLNAKKIYSQIQTLTEEMIKTSLCDKQNFPFIKDCSKEIQEVTVNTYSNHMGDIVFRSIPYKEMYSRLDKERMYNLKMLDGALIQMQYLFRKDKIESHRLAFFPRQIWSNFKTSQSFIRKMTFIVIF